MMHCFTMSALRIPGIATLALLLTLFLPVLASAVDVALQPNQGPVGTGVTANGRGWSPITDVYIYVESQLIGGPVKTDPDGAFTTNFCMPDRQPGVYPVFFTNGRESFAPPFTITAGTPVACQISGTNVILEQALTHNGTGTFGDPQTIFSLEEIIRYAAIVNNVGDSTVTPTFNFRATLDGGSYEIFSWTGDVSIPPGEWYFHLHTSVPADARPGSYTLRVTM